MPNHIANRLTINGEKKEVESVLAFIKDDKEEISFNKIIPMPESLNIEHSSVGTWAMTYIIDLVKGNKDVALEAREKHPNILDDANIKLGVQMLENKVLYGDTDWYGWRVAHWGTKWDAYDIVPCGNIIEFNTAWSAPVPVIQELAKKFPDVGFTLEWADEDCGYNTGSIKLKGETSMGGYLENDSDEAWEMYFDLHGDMDDFEKVNGKWRYKDA